MAGRRSIRAMLLSRRMALAGLVLLALPGTIVLAIVGYLMFAEWRSPSHRVSISINGDRLELEQPFSIVTPPPTGETPVSTRATNSSSIGPPDRADQPGGRANRTSQETPLPPVHLEIPTISVDAPVILSDNDNLPQIPVAGWYFKSAFPATAGNLVLIGHVDGDAAVFGQLHVLAPGDELRVLTDRRIHTYVVDEVFVVDESAVDVLAPTDDPTVTLITCAGEWNPVSQSYDERLVARGSYVAVQERETGLP